VLSVACLRSCARLHFEAATPTTGTLRTPRLAIARAPEKSSCEARSPLTSKITRASDGIAPRAILSISASFFLLLMAASTLVLVANQHDDGPARHAILQRLQGAFVAGFEKVERAFEAGIDHSPPRVRCALLYLKSQFLPIGVDHHVDVDVLLRSAVQGKGEAAGIVCKVGIVAHPIPTDILAPEPAPRQ